jgi:probable non-F420 flavinoid oxidoreductase
MGIIGYHCSHEQFGPSELLHYARRAEAAGFTASMCSDHFHPWLEGQGQSGFAWSWLGAALASTSMSFGVVNAPGQRYHPAIVAQASATLAEMFSGRFWLALGTGQLLNEHITGHEWPDKSLRRERLRECVTVMKALWAGETVTHEGLITVKHAKLYSRPAQQLRIVGAAVSAESAQWVGSWADALITVFKPAKELRQVIDAFHRGGGEGKPMYLQAQTSYAKTEDTARQAAFDQWRQCGLESETLTELATPADFARKTSDLVPSDMDDKVRISADLKQHAAWIEEYFELGFDAVYLHQTGREQEQFIDAFGEHVLPAVTKRSEFRAYT